MVGLAFVLRLALVLGGLGFASVFDVVTLRRETLAAWVCGSGYAWCGAP